MENVYKILKTDTQVDLIPYIKNYVSTHRDIEILVGCDSQNDGQYTKYAVVIALYTPGKGAHVIYTRKSTSRLPIAQNITRLLNEVWFSVEIAELIKSQLNIQAKYIDIDLNPDPRFGSNKALTNAVGIVTGMGYNVRHKGNSPVMCYAADRLVK